MSTIKQTQSSQTKIGRFACAISLSILSLVSISSLQAQTNYYVDYSHNISVQFVAVDLPGAEFQKDLITQARVLSIQPESIRIELDIDNFNLFKRRGKVGVNGMDLSHESHFLYSDATARDELYTRLNAATTHSDLVNTVLNQVPLTLVTFIESINSRALSKTDATANPLHDQVFNDPIRSSYCIQRKYTFTHSLTLDTEVLKILHQEQLNGIIADAIEVDSEILFPIAIENDFTLTKSSNPALIDSVWIQTFWFSSEAAMNHTLTSLKSIDENTDTDSHFHQFLSATFPYSLNDFAVTDKVGSPVGPVSLDSIVYNNGQVDLLLKGGANESHLLSWSEDLKTWSGLGINLSIDNGTINASIDQTLHVVPSTDGATLSVTFPATAPDKAFFRLKKSTLLRP